MIQPEEIARNVVPTGDIVFDVYRFLRAFFLMNQFQPTLGELARAIDIIARKTSTTTSRSIAKMYLNELDRRGWVKLEKSNGNMIPGRFRIVGAKVEYDETVTVVCDD